MDAGNEKKKMFLRRVAVKLAQAGDKLKECAEELRAYEGD